MKKKDMYIEVAVALPLKKTFTYAVPEPFIALASIGKRVLVPLGRRKVSAYILNVSAVTEIDAPKPIIDVLDYVPLFPPNMVNLYKWMADYYFYPIGLVIKNAMPGGLNIRERPALGITAEGRATLKNEILTPMERLVLSTLSTAPASQRKLEKAIKEGSSAALLQHLLKRGWITGMRTLKKDSVRAKTCPPVPSATKNSRSVSSGSTAAIRLAIPGFAIGVGGRPSMT